MYVIFTFKFKKKETALIFYCQQLIIEKIFYIKKVGMT